MFQNKMPRYEILSKDAMATLDKGWKRIVSEIGIEFMSERALDLFKKAGQKIEGNNVKFDPEFILEQIAKAPREFDVQARNPKNSVHIGGDSMVFSGVYGPPFVRDGAVRRDATMEDFKNFAKHYKVGLAKEIKGFNVSADYIDNEKTKANITDKHDNQLVVLSVSKSF